MVEAKGLEKVVFPLTHTIFMARDMPPIGEISKISVAPTVTDIKNEEEEISCCGELAVDVAYHSKEGEGELHHAQVNVPMTEALPKAWAGVSASGSSITTENISWQVLTNHALELVGTLVLAPIDSKQREFKGYAVNTVLSQNEMAEPLNDDIDLKYIRPLKRNEPISESGILAQMNNKDKVANDLSAELAEPISEADVSEPTNTKPEDIPKTANDELAPDIMEGDLARLEQMTAEDFKTDNPESDDELGDKLDDASFIPELVISSNNDVPNRPYAVTETVGNEYRMKFYLVQMGEDLDAIASKHQVTRESLQAANQVSEEEIRTGMVLNIPE